MLANVQENGYKMLTSSNFWIILLAIVFFICIAIYVYNKYVSPMVNKEFVPNQEYVDENTSDSNNNETVILYMFVVEWCPHSKKALPVWEKIKEKYNGKAINNYTINFILVDGEAEADLADKYKVEGYPTIKLVKGNQVIEYDAKPSVEHLTEFLNSTLN